MLGGLELKDKKLFPPLQTADIAAYALYQGRKEMRQRKTFGWGVKHLEQFDDLPVYVVHVDDEMFTLMKLRPEYLFVSQMK